jgi:hypothetical protein
MLTQIFLSSSFLFCGVEHSYCRWCCCCCQGSSASSSDHEPKKENITNLSRETKSSKDLQKQHPDKVISKDPEDQQRKQKMTKVHTFSLIFFWLLSNMIISTSSQLLVVRNVGYQRTRRNAKGNFEERLHIEN